MSLSLLTVVFAGIIIGLLLGLTGGGGSILTVPLLVYVVGLEPKIAIATSLLVVGLASMAALLPHSRSGNVFWRTGIVFGLAGMCGAFGGGMLARYIPEFVLLLLFGAVMIGSGLAMLKRPQNPASEGVPEQNANTLTNTGVTRNGLRIVADGLVVGVVTGLVGAGGGFLVVPALALLGGLPMHAAVGTSLLVIAMKCFAGLAGYITHVPVDLESAIIVGGFAMVGTVVGCRLSARFSATQLQRGFGMFVILIALALLSIEGSGLLAGIFDVSRLFAGIGVLMALLAGGAAILFSGRRPKPQLIDQARTEG